jgi:Uncharacterised protein family (UPF0236)
MKFSTETHKEIEKLIVADFVRQLETEEVKAGELEQVLRNSLQVIGKASYGEMLSLMDEHNQGTEAVCQCGEMGKRVSKREARVLSVFGWSEYRRSYYQCLDCGHRWTALDKALGLRAGQATELMSSLLGLAGITVSFEEARRQIQQYLQVDVSANTIRQETQLIGEKQADHERTWITQSQDLAYLQERERQPKGPKRLYGSIDGAFVPLEEEWKEAKTVCWYQEGSRYGSTGLHAQEIAYYTSLEPAETFGQLLWGTGIYHQADQAGELIFVCDGATWIWNLVKQYFPDAVQIVDWYHACQYLHPVAEALLLSEEEQNNWITQMKTLLWNGEVEDVIQKCRTLLDQVGYSADRLISYYTNNLERMRYANFRAKGYFIGSGTVKSGCKQIITMRLKRSGARWTQHGAAMTAKARTAWLSGSWQNVTQLPLVA